MGNGFKVLKKNHFSPQTSHIIPICFLNIFSIQLWYKSLFFFCSWFKRGERESNCKISMVEREKCYCYRFQLLK
jgi:hypothetical protein